MLDALSARAQLNQSYLTIIAPQDGVVTKVDQLQVGDYINLSTPVFTLVSSRLWVDANFKENQLEYMRVGQTGWAKLDAYPHRKFKGTFEGNSHTVRLEPGSLAERAVGEHEHVAHCHHHQSVLALGDGLVVTGRAEDGVVEAIESAEGHWALGVQWHPEADDRSRLFGALCDAARAYAARDGHRISKPPSPSGSSSRTSTVSTSA